LKNSNPKLAMIYSYRFW